MGRALVAEFVGTFALIFVGVLSIATGGGLVAVALAHGITIAVMATATAATSGGHLNPAVSIAMAAAGKMPVGTAVGYVVSQLLAGVAGAFAAAYAVGADVVQAAGYGMPALSTNVDMARGIFVEAVLTFFLMFAILGTAVDRRAPKVGGLYIGLAVTLDIFAGGPITGAAMNPARWFGPAVQGGGFANAAVYLVGPIVGALLAALLYGAFLDDKAPLPEDSELRTTA